MPAPSRPRSTAILIKGESGLLGRSPRGFLRKIAQETGGSFFSPDKVGELNKVFSGISDELHHHYALAYTPKKAPDGSWRTIEVRLVGRKDDAGPRPQGILRGEAAQAMTCEGRRRPPCSDQARASERGCEAPPAR